MTIINIQAGPFRFKGRLETEAAPQTCEKFLNLLPYHQKVIHSRWSGEAVWIPLGDFDLGVGFENHTSHASRGDFLFYPGGYSETEFLFVYGSSIFASKMGQLAGNRFMSLIEGHEHLMAFGKLVLWEGAQDIIFSMDD
ncbi:MAG: DUF3830 family protein [Chloroflexota bacterium]